MKGLDKLRLQQTNVIRNKFEAEFWSEENQSDENPYVDYGITGTSLGGSHYDGKTEYPRICVCVLSEAAEEKLTAELRKRDSSHEFLYFEGAYIEITVTGEIVLAAESTAMDDDSSH